MSAMNRTVDPSPDVSDADLIRASKSDPAAFGSLFDRHVDAIYGYISRRVGAPLAEELTAETFARAFAGRASFVALHDEAGPWLFGIATNLVHNARRAEQRQLLAYAKAASIATDPPPESDRADARVDALRARPRLVEALLELDPGDRDALLLFAWQDLSYKDVGTALGIPAGTVASRINRSRRLLRNALTADSAPDGEGTV